MKKTSYRYDVDLGVDMKTNNLNIKCNVSHYNYGYMYYTTPKQHLKLNS